MLAWDNRGVTTRAPWTPDQVASLNGYQKSGVFHEYTCGNDLCPGVSGQKAVLVATPDGWRCPACIYTQAWAMDMMADGTWRDFGPGPVSVDGIPLPGKWEIGERPE